MPATLAAGVQPGEHVQQVMENKSQAAATVKWVNLSLYFRQCYVLMACPWPPSQPPSMVIQCTRRWKPCLLTSMGLNKPHPGSRAPRHNPETRLAGTQSHQGACPDTGAHQQAPETTLQASPVWLRLLALCQPQSSKGARAPVPAAVSSHQKGNGEPTYVGRQG